MSKAEAARRYNQSEKGRARNKAAKARYWATPHGKAVKRAQHKRYMDRKRAMVLAAKERPCVDCGIDWLPAAVMQMDHVRGEKEFLLSAATQGSVSLPRLEAELAKCEPRCPNCHAMRHYEEDPR